MLSYLPYDEPSWLSHEPEPNPRHQSGTCRVCDTTHYDGPGEEMATSPCACGAAMCCEYCDRCRECGDYVCSTCAVDTSKTSRAHIMCSDCYQVYLDEVSLDESNLALRPVQPQGLNPLISKILDAFRAVNS